MNGEELAANPRLDEFHVQDLNESPALPYPNATFDFVLNAVSVQYLKRPFEVFREVARVLRPGGHSLVAMSHRCFPTKAIRAFHVPGGGERFRLVSLFHEQTDCFEQIESIDRSPPGADPLWIVSARRIAHRP
jgi:SAM-dependent methyltransferase